MSGGYVDPYGFSKSGKSSHGGGGGYVDPYGFGKKAKAGKPSKPQHHGGGGVLGAIGGFFKHVAKDAEGTITGIPTGVETLGRAVGHDVRHPHNLLNLAEGAGLSTVAPALAWKRLKHTETGQKFLKPIGENYAHEYGPLLHGHFRQFGHQLYEHPLGPILDAATVLTLGAGGVAKAGSLLGKAGMIAEDSRLARLGEPVNLSTKGFGPEGDAVLVKQSARNPAVKYRQILVNKALNKLPSETPLMGSTARAVRALSRAPAKEAARLDVQARDFNAAFNRLSKPERVVWHLKARGLNPAEYRAFIARSGHASPGMLKILENPKVHELYANPSARLQDALHRGSELSDKLTASRVAAGHLDEQTALEAPYRHLRMMSGAEVKPVVGESPALTAAKQERDALAAAHEKALQAQEKFHHESLNKDLGPLSEKDAHARLAQLDKQYEELIQKTIPHVSPYVREQGRGGRMYDPEQLARNYAKGKSGKARLTVKEEERQLADEAIRKTIASRSHEPAAQAVARLLHERDQLSAALQNHADAAIFGHEPGPLPAAPMHAHASVRLQSNPYENAVVTLGHRLEAAQQKVDRLAGKTAQTGAVKLQGGKSVEDIIREIEARGGEHPFHVPDSAHVPGLRRGRFGGRPSGFSAPDMAVKQTRLALARHGRFNPYENALGRDYARYQDRAAAQMLHDELVKHASIIPRNAEIPRGFEEIKLNRGQSSAPFMQQIAQDLEHHLAPPDLRARISQMGHLQPRDVNGGFEEAHRLIVPRQVKRLLEDESKSYAGRLAAIRRVPLNVWKGAVLGLRPAFFANITIGNSVLGTLQMAPGRWGFVGWLNQVLPGFHHVAGAPLDEATMKEVFPEQVSGTFGGSVAPHGYHGGSRVLRAGSRAAQGVMPATIGYENVLRRAMAEGWARSMPEVQKLLERNGGDVNDALRKLASSHPQTIDNISRRIDNALGNYRTYNRFERAIKAVVPFYGWNRHITSSLFRLASERPQVLDALLNTSLTGRAKAEHLLAGLPAYLDQSLAAHLPGWLGGQHGHGVQTVLNPEAWNPFTTLTDEGRLAAFPFTGAGTTSDAFPIAPDVQALIEQMTGKNMMTGAPIRGNALKDELLNLIPQEALLTSKHPRSPHSINQNHLYAQILRLLGLPVENVNMPAARQKWRTIDIPVK